MMKKSLADRCSSLRRSLLAFRSRAQTRGVTAEDYFAFETLGDPHFSPDGSTIAFVVTTIDQKQNRRRSAIWLGAGRRLARAAGADDGAAVVEQRRDGVLTAKAIAFLSARPAPATTTRPAHAGLAAAARRRRAAAGDATCRTASPASSGRPTARSSSCVSRSGPSDTAKSPSDVRHYLHANYKFNDTGWFDDKRAHLWVVDVASGARRRSPPATTGTTPIRSGRPTAARIAFVSDRTGKAFDESHNTDVWVIDAERRAADEDLGPRQAATTRRAGRRTAGRSRSSARCRRKRIRRSGWRRRPAAARRGSRPTASI